MSPRQHTVLKAIAFRPRSLRDLCHSDGMHLSAHVAESYLGALEEGGYIELSGQTYCATPLGLAYLTTHEKAGAPSNLFGPWSYPSGSYRPQPWASSRAGADDHKQFYSRGL